ncbi:MAG: uracil-DNA glycosylase family protein [Halioglobus sp.]
MTTLIKLVEEVRACRLCAKVLSHKPRPIVSASASARLLVIGQAPGSRVHESGVPWDDKSGDRLRQWLNVSRPIFYDNTKVAIMPMGFCYPGKGRSGDLPPRPECAPYWHEKFLSRLPEIRLTLLVGQYAQRYYLDTGSQTLTDTVAAWREHLPAYFALPHPSPRNQIWLKKNPWFENEVLVELQAQVKMALA